MKPKILDRIFWALLLGIASYAASEVKEITTSINELNIKMAVLIEKMSRDDKTLENHEGRLSTLENAISHK